MTRIFFRHGAADRIQAAAAWLAELWAQRNPATVYAPDHDIAERLDRMLWQQPALGFLPHCRVDSPLADDTPILIAERLDGLPKNARLLNLGREVPPEFARFEEVLEVVSTADDDRLPARERYRYYRERGYELHNQDLSRT